MHNTLYFCPTPDQTSTVGINPILSEPLHRDQGFKTGRKYLEHIKIDGNELQIHILIHKKTQEQKWLNT